MKAISSCGVRWRSAKWRPPMRKETSRCHRQFKDSVFGDWRSHCCQVDSWPSVYGYRPDGDAFAAPQRKGSDLSAHCLRGSPVVVSHPAWEAPDYCRAFATAANETYARTSQVQRWRPMHRIRRTPSKQSTVQPYRLNLSHAVVRDELSDSDGAADTR